VRQGALDLGHGHTARPFVWDPDLDLNPQYADPPLPGSPDETVGYIIDHPRADDPSKSCSGAIHLDTPRTQRMGEQNRWAVHSLDPLHVEPSVLCRQCGDHGFIRDGKWVVA